MDHRIRMPHWDGYPSVRRKARRSFPTHLFTIPVRIVLAAFYVWLAVIVQVWSFQIVCAVTAVYLLLPLFVKIFETIR